MGAVDGVLAELGDLAVETQPQKVRRRSRDFYWYSPILQAPARPCHGRGVVTPRDEAEIVRTVAACHRHRVPLTVRGGGTGNYGQAMPLQGGIVLDLSELTAVRAISRGRVRAEAGIKLADARRGHHRRQPAGASAASQHAQDRHDRRLYRRRQLGHRLDHLGPAARSRQHPDGAGRDHGGRATHPRAARRRHPEGQPRLRHQRRDHRARAAAGAGLSLGRALGGVA